MSDDALQMRGPVHQRAAGFGFPSVRVDGNDVLACLAVTRDARDRALLAQPGVARCGVVARTGFDEEQGEGVDVTHGKPPVVLRGTV